MCHCRGCGLLWACHLPVPLLLTRSPDRWEDENRQMGTRAVLEWDNYAEKGQDPLLPPLTRAPSWVQPPTPSKLSESEKTESQTKIAPSPSAPKVYDMPRLSHLFFPFSQFCMWDGI